MTKILVVSQREWEYGWKKEKLGYILLFIIHMDDAI